MSEQELADLFDEAGIAVPPVPADLAPGLRRIHDWCFASRDIDAFEMYMFGRYLHEVVTGPVKDYVAVSHAGHGINSYGLNYHLVYGWIAVFLQLGWGGAYDGSDTPQRIEAWFSKCGDVVGAVERHNPRPDGVTGRLIVATSDFREVNLCRWLPSTLDGVEGDAWIREYSSATGDRDQVPALDEAVNWLNEREHMPIHEA